MDNTRLARTAKIIDILLITAQIILVVLFVITAVSIPLTFTSGHRPLTSQLTMDFGFGTITAADDLILNQESFKYSIVIGLISTIILLAAGWYAIMVMRTIIAPMKTGRPFENGISAKIRRIAWLSLICGAIDEIFDMAGSVLMIRAVDFKALFNEAAVTDISYTYTMDFSFIIIAIILFLLSYIFQYGEALQKESDETL